MIVDTSAIMAILRDEPEAEKFAARIAAAETRTLSAGSWVELCAVITRSGDTLKYEESEAALQRFDMVIAPITIEQARIARDAYRRYGRGTRHPAGLNFGDCFAYALAKATGEPLLFKGDDFSQTDIVAAVPA
jgi:ribonuclease VapC